MVRLQQEPGALMPFAFLSHSSALSRNPWQKCQCPEPARTDLVLHQRCHHCPLQISPPMSLAAARPLWGWSGLSLPCKQSRDGLRSETSPEQECPQQGRAPCSATTVWPRELLGKNEAQLQDKEQKSQGNVTSVVISTHAKVPSAFFFFSPLKFQIPVCGGGR